MKFFVIICLLSCVFVANFAFAEEAPAPVKEAFGAIDSFTNTVGIFSSKVGVQTIAGKLILSIMGIIGSLSLVIFLYGGIMWMTAGADPGKVKKSKDTMLWASLGLAAIFLSYVIVRFIIEVVGQ